MRCPYCRQDNDKVIDSRGASEGTVIRRRRECLACGKRYTTYEQVEQAPLRVIKKDGSRVGFDGHKILTGLLKACEKRPVPTERLTELVRTIEREVAENFDGEVETRWIGERVMEELKLIDPVAYVRFASVYREFKDVSEFADELRLLESKS
ncbi:MAG: transcriptional regulator NrdR [Planctomycetota bacterium]